MKRNKICSEYFDTFWIGVDCFWKDRNSKNMNPYFDVWEWEEGQYRTYILEYVYTHT